MSQPISDSEISHLSSVEKLDLIGKLWDSLPEATSDLPLPAWHQQEIQKRLADADANPQAAVPWQEIQRRLRKKS